MRNLITITLSLWAVMMLLFNCNKSMAQCKLSGKVEHLNRADTMELRIPYVYGYNYDTTMLVPINKQGDFSANVPISQTKFVKLLFNGKVWTVMFKPGKQLDLTLNAADTSISNFKGSLAAANNLLYQIKAGQYPAFIKAGDRGSNRYAKGTAAEVTERVIKPWLALGDARVAQVQASALTVTDKRLIAQEARAENLSWIHYFVVAKMNIDKDDLIGLYKTLYGNVKVEPDIMPAGPQYYEFADGYIGYLESRAMVFMNGLDKAKAKTTPLPYFNISFDDGITLSKTKGKLYVNWLAIHNNYSKPVAEAMLAQFIANTCAEKNLTEARPLMDEMMRLYPQSKYAPKLSAKIKAMENNLAANQSNQAIQIVEGYEKVNSIYEIVNKYKGKVIYLDVWGTWCPPCRDELKFGPQLKQHFEGKDVVYIYLDMDDDAKDTHWRDFIKVNNISGIHLRKSKADIQKFWGELQPDKNKQGSYPTYFIFDKNGKPVANDAKRPSDKTKLYQQIAQYL